MDQNKNRLESPDGKHKFEFRKSEKKFDVVEAISLTPNSLAVYNRFFKIANSEVKTVSEIKEKYFFDEKGNITLVKPEKRNVVEHDFELSKQARKNLKSKVTWLYHFAKKQTIVTKKGKILSNFRMNFFTLKLPSEQIHSSDFITKNCLNQLFIEISKKFNFKNYVWRLEYQNNGNLHYHIATDCYIDYFFLLRAWNRILNKYGYVDLYTRKFESMSLLDYCKSQGKTDFTEFKAMSERYAKGCSEKWKNPNSVDVKAVFGKCNIAAYIAKYMSKNSAPESKKTLPICELNSKNSRLWFCSRSLSACKSVQNFREAEELDLYEILAKCEKVRKFHHDYCTVLYFNISELPPITARVIETRLEEYRRQIEYCSA